MRQVQLNTVRVTTMVVENVEGAAPMVVPPPNGRRKLMRRVCRRMGAPAAMLCLAGLSTDRGGPVVVVAAAAPMFLAPLHERWDDPGPALPAAAAALSSHAVENPIDRDVDDIKPIKSEGSSHASYLEGLCAPESLSRVLGRHREDSVAAHASEVLEAFDREVVGLFDDCRSELRDAMAKVRRLRMATSHTLLEDAAVARHATLPADDGSHSWRVQRFLLSEVSRAAGDWSGVVDRRAEWREQRRRRRLVLIAAPVVFVPKPPTKTAAASKQSSSASSSLSSASRPARSRPSTREGVTKAAVFDDLPLVLLHDSVVPVWTFDRLHRTE